MCIVALNFDILLLLYNCMWYPDRALLLNIFVNIPPEVRKMIHILVGGKLKVFFGGRKNKYT